MKMTKLLVTAVMSAGLAFGVAVQATEENEKAEQAVDMKNVPEAVQKAAQAEAKGGKIIRWEKEGNNYEAVIEVHKATWGVLISNKGKVLSKHDEGKEHKEKGEKY